jgi:hypothetical protein
VRAALAIIALGVVTFAVVFGLLQLPRPATVPVADAQPTPAPADGDVIALAAEQVAIGLPTAGSEALLRSVQTGDQVDVLASLPSAAGSQPLTAVVVSAATVLRTPTSGDPLLVQVRPPEAMLLAHLVLGGTRLSYLVRGAQSGDAPSPRPVSEATARALLGLGPTPTPGS